MSKWISVDKEMPKTRSNVLVRLGVCGGHNITEGYYNGVDWVDCWCSVLSAKSYPVQHWMPLPSPPQIGGG